MMTTFKFIAVDARSVETEGVLNAESQNQAVGMIRSRGLFPIKVMQMPLGSTREPVTGKRTVLFREKGMTIRLPAVFRRGVGPKQLTVFTRQLATLVQAGLPLLRGLRILLKQERNPALRKALSAMDESVESGSTFSDALAEHAEIFDKLFVNMVKAGEAGGVLDVVLVRLAEFMEKAERVKNKVRSAMIYPLVVLTAAIGILAFLMINVIPKFKQIFDDLLEGTSLPPLTQFVVNTSEAVQHNWPLIIGACILASVAFRTVRRTRNGRYAIDRFKLRMPLFGPIFIKTAVARFSRTLGTLMTSGVPVLQALNIVRDTSGNDVIANAIQQVHDSVKEGDNMSMPLEASGAFPAMVVSMVDVGEETGALPEMLSRVADTYEDEVDRAVEGLTSIIEPVMIIFLAMIVGTIVIAMFVPLVTILNDFGGR